MVVEAKAHMNLVRQSDLPASDNVINISHTIGINGLGCACTLVGWSNYAQWL